MPLTLLYPLIGEPVRFLSGKAAIIAGVECIDDGRLVRANVATAGGGVLMAVPVSWDEAAGVWVEVEEADEPMSDLEP